MEVEMCRGLSYNLTSFPNIWLSISDQREAAALLRQYRVKRLLSCIITVNKCQPSGAEPSLFATVSRF